MPGAYVLTGSGLTPAAVAPGGEGGGDALDVANFNPATDVDYTLSTSDGDVDATNLAVTFAAPESGVVLISAEIPYSADNQCGIFLMLRVGSSTVAGTKKRLAYGGSSNAAFSTYSVQGTAALSWYIDGLTPGNSYTYKLGVARFGVGTGAVALHAGPAWGPALMEVRSSPLV